LAITGLAVPLLFSVTKLTVILFQIGAVVLLKIPGVENAKLQIDCMKELGASDMSSESIVTTDFFFFFFRLFVLALIIICSKFGTDISFRVLVVFQMAMTLVTYTLTRIWWNICHKVISAKACFNISQDVK
jgi:hypothetical protein